MKTLILLLLLISAIHAKVHVQVINRLDNGQFMNVHCRSKDNDLGLHLVEDGGDTTWSFDVNFWGTTLFYCDVQWNDSERYHFDAYDAKRDYRRCQSECRWMIDKEGSLYGYDEQFGIWEMFPV
ncbi:Plant self-incompatibility protein S1 family [Abeliophyllum distichum]|uniref:S-protein homolog n=1 Tax=Abeliophyllum distichum TaxID=126358 RepID=A0ABD1VUF2_9LAMI